MLLQSGINNNLHQKEQWIKEIETLMNATVFGKGQHRIGHWKLPISIDNTDVIGDISFKGNTAEKILVHANSIIDLCIADLSKCIVWKTIIDKYNVIVSLLNS